jgi:hypothetical protein
VVYGDFKCYKNEELQSLFGMPVMDQDKNICCDNALGEKYGIADAEEKGFGYKELIATPLFQSELAKSRIRRQKQQEKQDIQAKRNAGYAAFKKRQAEERE